MLYVKGVGMLPRKTLFKLTTVALVGVILWIVWYSTTHDISEKSPEMNNNNNNNNADTMSDRMLFTQNSETGRAMVNLPANLSSVNIPLLERITDFSSSRKTKVVGLTIWNREFYLNNEPLKIFSGAVHYFRIVPEYWEDRLRKLKACGLNTVETYVAWNLHEPSPGLFNFQGLLNITRFINIAANIGLYVILRPGPFICSEFDFGGLPGWLLNDPNMKVRTNYPGYVAAVNRFFNVLLPMVYNLQYTEGGPIIMFQVENEYSVYGKNTEHLKVLVYLMKSYGVKEFLVTSDHNFKDRYAANKALDFSKYALPTDNFDFVWMNSFSVIRSLNKHFPVMVMEFWTGWFDFWGKEKHASTSVKGLNASLNFIMDSGGSFNLYMFIGGTNFGFTAGATNLSGYQPLVTSYDYDAVLTEAGDITPKYTLIRKRLLQYYNSKEIKNLPDVPPNTAKQDYGIIDVTEMMDWDTFLSLIPIATMDTKVNHMEKYKDHHGHFSTFGYIVYSHNIKTNESLEKLSGLHVEGYAYDRLLGILNNENFFTMDILSEKQSKVFPYYNWDPQWRPESYDYFVEHRSYYDNFLTRPLWQSHFVLRLQDSVRKMMKRRVKLPRRLDLMVENLGRVNFSPLENAFFDIQRKGLSKDMFHQASDTFAIWAIRFINFGLEQCKMFSESAGWKALTPANKKSNATRTPTLYRAYLDIAGSPNDTFVKLDGWSKGVVIVNGFNLGRYWHVGPQRTLYLPAPLLKKGRNEILVFEEVKSGRKIRFQNFPEL